MEMFFENYFLARNGPRRWQYLALLLEKLPVRWVSQRPRSGKVLGVVRGHPRYEGGGDWAQPSRGRGRGEAGPGGRGGGVAGDSRFLYTRLKPQHRFPTNVTRKFLMCFKIWCFLSRSQEAKGGEKRQEELKGSEGG